MLVLDVTNKGEIMIKKYWSRRIFLVGVIILFFGLNITTGMKNDLLEESTKIQLPINNPQNIFKSGGFQDDVLLIPDWTYDRVLAFDPYDGSYIGVIIPSDGRLSSPKCAIPSSRGTIFVSDQIADAVFEYDTEGNYITTIVNQASSGIDNIRGITVYNDYLYVTVFQGSHAETVQRFDLNGGNQMTWTSTQIDSPFDILFRGSDALVANANSDAIERYNQNGNWLGTFVGTGIQWPSQIYECGNGNLYVAGSFSPSGIYQYDPNGVLLHYYSISQTLRGVYELGNGLLLFTSSVSVSTYNPSNGQIVDIYTDGNFHFIHLLSSGLNHPPDEPSDPLPLDGATNININVNVSWSGGDPDGDPVTYDVYFGTTNPPSKVVSNQSSTTFNPETLEYNMTYYWQIIAWDNHSASTSGPLWHFTTIELSVPELEVESINGGFGVKAVIKNIGTVNATNVTWSISLIGGAFIGKLTENSIVIITPSTDASIKSKFIFGIGKTTIYVTATCNEGVIAERNSTGFVFGPFVLGVK